MHIFKLRRYCYNKCVTSVLTYVYTNTCTHKYLFYKNVYYKHIYFSELKAQLQNMHPYILTTSEKLPYTAAFSEVFIKLW